MIKLNQEVLALTCIEILHQRPGKGTGRGAGEARGEAKVEFFDLCVLHELKSESTAKTKSEECGF